MRVAYPCRAKTPPAIGAAARKLGLELQDFDVLRLQHLDMQRAEHFTQFVEHAQRTGTGAILIPNLPGLGRFLPLAGKLAAENRIPAIGFGRAFVESGGLLSFGPKEGEGQTAVASITHKIFLGAIPGDIPVVQQRAFTLTVNLQTAKSLGLTLSPTVLSRADDQL